MKTLYDYYKAAREEQSKYQPFGLYFPGRAMEAVRMARCAMKADRMKKKAGLSLPRWCDDKEETHFPNGDVLSIEILPDSDSEGPFSDVEQEPMAGMSGREVWQHAPDWWIDREGRIWSRGDRYRDKSVYTIGKESGYSLAAYEADARELNYPRGLVPLYARYHMGRVADSLREASQDGASAYGYVVKIEDKHGDQVGEFSCWGFDDFDYCVEEAESVALGLIEQRRADVRKAIKTGRADMHKTRRAFNALRLELKRLRGIHAPAACGALNEKLAKLRGQFVAQLREVIESKEAARAYRRLA